MAAVKSRSRDAAQVAPEADALRARLDRPLDGHGGAGGDRTVAIVGIGGRAGDRGRADGEGSVNAGLLTPDCDLF